MASISSMKMMDGAGLGRTPCAGCPRSGRHHGHDLRTVDDDGWRQLAAGDKREQRLAGAGGRRADPWRLHAGVLKSLGGAMQLDQLPDLRELLADAADVVVARAVQPLLVLPLDRVCVVAEDLGAGRHDDALVGVRVLNFGNLSITSISSILAADELDAPAPRPHVASLICPKAGTSPSD
ncbi:hypothetical protein ZWY2020_038695 [Hordeum vulgare]|nr:hypothetical protein ZWY2020_038695 [Hordeum vulgare]